ncbi:hypothetical protein Q4489_07755 [Thalassotalea sp. 1_MG-2023]|uniref:hypothetical protein n=1 Tax=Thalassotalea sp. 1_MG-2023 TaxID=3062680 RepID=UPI0026E13F89|nr:hypothetical protein [Thalassotalea sp. 1_MG-2023]MDO6426899.1 hypothetical protein [Thalassotalea sp. 1_MG-2023]
MSNRVEPEIPNITLDDDHIKPSSTKTTNTNSNTTAKSVTPPSNKTSGVSVFFTVAIYIALAGTGYYFFEQNKQLKSSIDDADHRIQQLEDQLSATGEEMGESTVALKAKLQAISEKTEKLWAEMDKLWASAWRRNQSEIKELRAQNKKQDSANSNVTNTVNTLAASVGNITEKQTATEFTVDALSEQVQQANMLKQEINQLSDDMAAIQQNIQGRNSQQIEVASNVNSLDMQIKMLIERIESLENKKAVTIPPGN